MEKFLCGDVKLLCLASAYRDLPKMCWKCISPQSRFCMHIIVLALIEGYLFAIRPGLGGAVRGLFNLQGNHHQLATHNTVTTSNKSTHLAGESLGHLGPLAGLGLVVPELLLVSAGHVRDDELDVLLHQLALLPGHGLALVSPGPDLRAFLVLQMIIDMRMMITPAAHCHLSPRA